MHALKEKNKDFDSELFVDVVTAPEEDDKDSAYADIKIGTNDTVMTFKLDTGAQTRVIPQKEFNKLRPSIQPKKDKHRLYGYRGHPLKVEGYCNLAARYKDRTTLQKFHIVDCNGPPILGYKACKALGLINVVYAASATSRKAPSSQTYCVSTKMFQRHR